MFTGIIQKVISISRVHHQNGGLCLKFIDDELTSSLQKGDSVAVDGICTTVNYLAGNRWECEIGRETLEKTVAGSYHSQRPVNIECALRLNDRLSGHFVTGHVDGTGKIISISSLGKEQMAVTFQYPPELGRFIAYKGSITLQGVSLTVNEVKENQARVNIVSYTYHNTTFAYLKEGDYINIETDLLAKYVMAGLDHQDNNEEKDLWQILKSSGYM